MINCRCACCQDSGCHCLDYAPQQHCDCAQCEETIGPVRRSCLALSAQAGEDAHNRERIRWGLAAV